MIFADIIVITTVLGKMFGEKLKKNNQNCTKVQNFDVCFSVGFDNY